MLKSGCRLAARQCQWAERLQRCRSRSSGLAWRMFSATMLVRSGPEAPGRVRLEPDAWPARSWAIHRVPMPPAEPPTLRQAVKMDRTARRVWGAPSQRPTRKGLQSVASICSPVPASLKPDSYRLRRSPAPLSSRRHRPGGSTTWLTCCLARSRLSSLCQWSLRGAAGLCGCH